MQVEVKRAEPPVDKVILELSEDEAHIIFALIGATHLYHRKDIGEAVDNMYRSLRKGLGILSVYGKYRSEPGQESFKLIRTDERL